MERQREQVRCRRCACISPVLISCVSMDVVVSHLTHAHHLQLYRAFTTTPTVVVPGMGDNGRRGWKHDTVTCGTVMLFQDASSFSYLDHCAVS